MLMATERLILRRFRASDAPVLAEYRSDPAVARYQPWDAPFPLEKAEAAVRAYAEASPDTPGHFQYAVELAAEQALIGDVYVRLHDNLRQAEIGFSFATAYQKRGFATEAVSAVLNRLFRRDGFHKVTGECDLRNTRSAALLERLGFRREGLLRQQTLIKGEWTDDLLYGLLATEWSGEPAR
ncbi:RimJ/RimL family protein N-acetyltransferase [Actinoplanes campanulatus]|uniref:RimJ/RimL family protein N-acetyltransferase n=2 Tax=Actinoplanes campanulatus TaxID=113559 RepID=A0A7W5ANL2_9ACTN|nr:RimJ/RimL family protein N-acetyltransferase [Actinoplanes campanulatus]GGN42100.1 N-acetyltransferase [Actinoplanes campanulatus]GID39939.1 N-acetyltransferase [Actinoplanes campanulatus]